MSYIPNGLSIVVLKIFLSTLCLKGLDGLFRLIGDRGLSFIYLITRFSSLYLTGGFSLLYRAIGFSVLYLTIGFSSLCLTDLTGLSLGLSSFKTSK